MLADKRNKDILNLGKATTDRLDTTKLTAKAQQKLNTLSIIKNRRNFA